jgi:hypothetical protein
MSVLNVLECPKLPNIYAIIGGSIVGVTVIGILILLFIKVFFTLKDLKEYRKFRNDAQKTKWSDVSDICLHIKTWGGGGARS